LWNFRREIFLYMKNEKYVSIAFSVKGVTKRVEMELMNWCVADKNG